MTPNRDPPANSGSPPPDTSKKSTPSPAGSAFFKNRASQPSEEKKGTGMFDPIGISQKQSPPSKASVAPELTNLSNLPPPPVSKPKTTVVVADSWADSDWNFDDIKASNDNLDIGSKDYKLKNLNKLSDLELAREKQKMDIKFNENFVKPNDPKFVYDKVVDFSKQAKDDNSWDNEEEEDYTQEWEN